MTTASELAHLFRALKAPAAARSLPALADRAREEQWSYERFAEMLLATEVNARESHGGEGRIKTARFPARKTLEEVDFTFQRSVKKTVIEHLGQLDFLHAKDNVLLLGPSGTGKTHIATALGIRACLAGQRVIFASATQWVARLGDAKRHGQLRPSSNGCRSRRCSWLMKLATSRLIPRPRTSCSPSLKGDSYRLRGKELDARIGAKPAENG